VSATLKKPDPVHEGKTWRDMPGNTPIQQRMNFALWKRGKFKLPTAEFSKLRGVCANAAVVYAEDSEEILRRIDQVCKARGISRWKVTDEAAKRIDGMQSGSIYGAFQRGTRFSLRIADVLRGWLSEQKEDAA
jgi:hypothetical protein